MIKNNSNNNTIYLDIKSKPIVSFEDMLQGLEYIESNEELPRELKILEDATDSVITFTLSDIDILIDRMNNISKKYKFIRHAVIHNSPKNTAFAMLIQKNKKANNFKLGIFSTRESAIKWLSEY